MYSEENYFPNQRCIRINRQSVIKNSGRLYANIYKDNIIQAMRNLKPTAFKVWLYIASNKQDYTLEYSPSYLSKIISISIQSAKNAFKELNEKGYLIKDSDKEYFYDFYEVSQIETTDKPIEEIRIKHEAVRKIENKTYSKQIIDIMQYNNIKLDDVKMFRDVYNDGTIDEYEMSFRELLDATDINTAIYYWFNIDENENTYETDIKLHLISEDEIEEVKEMEV